MKTSCWHVIDIAKSENRHEEKITKSSGNVFVDLGFDPAEAAVLHMRSNIMSDLRLYIEKHKLTQF